MSDTTTEDQVQAGDIGFDTDELFQTKAVTLDDFAGERDYEYPLTAFIPKSYGTSGDDAAVWIIPDINDVVVVRQIKMFETTFIPKVPPAYNVLYCRVDRTNRPNLTDFQDQVRQSVVSQYKGKDGLVPLQQVYLLPVIRKLPVKQDAPPVVGSKDEWAPAIAEVGVTAYAEIKRAIATADDLSDGRITPLTRPMRIWKSGQREITVKFDRNSDADVPALIKEHRKNLQLEPREYVKLRATHTEAYLRAQWAAYKSGGSPVAAHTEISDRERYVEAVMNMTTAQMKALLQQHGISIAGAKAKPGLIELMLDNRDACEAEVLASTVPF
jgi:hypothetical protein